MRAEWFVRLSLRPGTNWNRFSRVVFSSASPLSGGKEDGAYGGKEDSTGGIEDGGAGGKEDGTGGGLAWLRF